MEKYFSVLQTVREHVKLNYQRTINDNDVCLVRRPRSSKPVAPKTFNQRYCWMRPSLRRRTTKKNMTRKKKTIQGNIHNPFPTQSSTHQTEYFRISFSGANKLLQNKRREYKIKVLIKENKRRFLNWHFLRALCIFTAFKLMLSAGTRTKRI